MKSLITKIINFIKQHKTAVISSLAVVLVLAASFVFFGNESPNSQKELTKSSYSAEDSTDETQKFPNRMKAQTLRLMTIKGKPTAANPLCRIRRLLSLMSRRVRTETTNLIKILNRNRNRKVLLPTEKKNILPTRYPRASQNRQNLRTRKLRTKHFIVRSQSLVRLYLII